MVNHERGFQNHAQNHAFGVYVHWPFCLSKCPYCDFNIHVRHARSISRASCAAFDREIESTANRMPPRTVSSIFFGGGTPSLMEPATVGGILDSIAKHWTIDPNVEITARRIPTSGRATRFQGYRTAGINRVSLGVQALDDISLKELGACTRRRKRSMPWPSRASISSVTRSI